NMRYSHQRPDTSTTISASLARSWAHSLAWTISSTRSMGLAAGVAVSTDIAVMAPLLWPGRAAGIWWLNPLNTPYAVACQSSYVHARQDLVGVHARGTNENLPNDLTAGRVLLLRVGARTRTPRFVTRPGLPALEPRLKRRQALAKPLLLGARFG